MERDGKRKKKKRESLEERCPLQHLIRLPFQRIKRNTPSSSAPSSSRFLLPASPSYSRTHLHNKPKFSPEIAKMEPNKSRFLSSNPVPRFKENETPTKPILQKSTKKKPQFTEQRRNWSSDVKPTFKDRQRSNLLSVHGISESKEKKGFQEFQKNMKKSDGKSMFALDNNPNCTPLSVRAESAHESAIDDSVCERNSANTASDVKTPPVEASLSPEIQSQPQSKMVSVGTPVSYGAGHLLSGVSGKQKSRRRGSLRGGLEKVIPFSDVDDMQESSIPLLAEASIRWHLSPCDFGNDLDKERMEYDDDLCTIDLLSSLDFSCSKSRYSGSSRLRNNVMFSPRKAIESLGILDDSMLITSPQAAYDCNGITLSRDDSVLSLGSWNSGNSVHILESHSSSDAEARFTNSVRQEFDSITETLERVKLSPRREISMWDAPGLGSHYADIGRPPISLVPIRLQKDADCVSSWVSDTKSDDPTLSQIRMSWSEVLASKIAGVDEFDCCCLSDEQIGGDERVNEKETDQGSNMIAASVVNKENGFRTGDELSPVLLDYEPCLIAEGKEKSFRNDLCAESICTDGGGLLASGDSDWTYFQENPLVSCHIEQFKED